RSAATCLNEVISSAARLRLATSCEDASRLVSRKSFRLDRLRSPRATSAANNAVLRSRDEATVRLMPTGLLTSWATPATSRPSAASFSASISDCWVSRKLRNAASAAPFALRIPTPPPRAQPPPVVLVGLLRAVARHQIGRGAADRVRRLNTEDAGHVAVHQNVAQLLVLEVDDRGYGADPLLQQPPAFGDRVLGAFLIGDIAHRPFITDDPAGLVAHGRGAV